MPWLWYCGVYSQNSEIYIIILKLCKTNITCNVTCFPRTCRHKTFHFTVLFQTATFGKYERKISWIVERYGQCGMIWKIWKKGKLNSGKIWKIQNKIKLNSEKILKIGKKNKFKSEKIRKIWKKNKLKSEKI